MRARRDLVQLHGPGSGVQQRLGDVLIVALTAS